MKVWNLIRKTIVLALAVLGLSLTLASPSYASDLSGSWVLVSIDGGSLEAESLVTLEIEDESLRGKGGCNMYFSSFSANAGSIRISSPITTKLYCEFIKQEFNYLDALESAQSYQIGNGTLTIQGRGHVLKYEPA